jgi:glutamate-ammonia-ligase adenylyltransferase
VRTLAAYRSFYERYGEPWELQALTQARFVAGDEHLGLAFVDMVGELLYRDPPPVARLTAVRQMKARVERERGGNRPPRIRGVTGSTAPARQGARVDVKLGPGGMSDVEWTVQLLQLAHGRRLPSLRTAGTLHAIDACVAQDLLTEQEGAWLRDGWCILARVRNALFLAGARDTQRLPGAPDAVERLARMLGYPRPGAQNLRQDLARTMRRIRKVHERRFYDDDTLQER